VPVERIAPVEADREARPVTVEAVAAAVVATVVRPVVGPTERRSDDAPATPYYGPARHALSHRSTAASASGSAATATAASTLRGCIGRHQRRGDGRGQDDE